MNKLEVTKLLNLDLTLRELRVLLAIHHDIPLDTLGYDKCRTSAILKGLRGRGLLDSQNRLPVVVDYRDFFKK